MLQSRWSQESSEKIMCFCILGDFFGWVLSLECAACLELE